MATTCRDVAAAISASDLHTADRQTGTGDSLVSLSFTCIRTSSFMPVSSSIMTQASMGRAISRCSSRAVPNAGFSIQESRRETPLHSDTLLFAVCQLFSYTLYICYNGRESAFAAMAWLLDLVAWYHLQTKTLFRHLSMSISLVTLLLRTRPNKTKACANGGLLGGKWKRKHYYDTEQIIVSNFKLDG
ncbi:hypothetical protein EYF80_023629 [Liparis tanakae]|uniref:Uncharacterized protein n=1 Tax=Liparis tanakae TaxID=230148 RepID=A0A4Z2HKN0_9TELE|nr:hypothetical protein EYF80_023629 [Liparis tanakae]